MTRTVSSQAVRVKTFWFVVIADVNGVCEQHLGYKYYDKSIGFWSAAPNNSASKPPWGALRSCEFKPGVKNGKGEVGDYFEMVNEYGSKRLFKINIMNPMLWDVNDFTQNFSGLRVNQNEDLLGVYMTLMNSAKRFRCHNPDIHD